VIIVASNRTHARQSILRAGEMILSVREDNTALTITDGALLIENGTILEVARGDELVRRFPRLQISGSASDLAVPGLVNAHHHVGLTPFQLGVADMPLERWALARMAVREVDPYLDTLVSAFEMIASGVTCVQHILDTVEGEADTVVARLQAIAQAYDDIGMRASLCYGVADQNFLSHAGDSKFLATLPDDLCGPLTELLVRIDARPEAVQEVFAGLVAVLDGKDRIRPQLAAANLHWCSDRMLALVADTSARFDVPVHMHLLETAEQRRYADARAPQGVIRHLERLGFDGPRLTLGHGTWLSTPDIEALAASGASVCINCSSNMRLQSGTAPLGALERAGVNTAIGIDEAGLNDNHDMLLEMRLLHAMDHSSAYAPNGGGGGRVLRMATEGGARTTPFVGQVGRLEPGYRADVALFDRARLAGAWLDSDQTAVDVVLRRGGAGSLRAVICDGETILEGGTFLRINHGAVLSELGERMARPPTSEEHARKLLTRYLLSTLQERERG